MRTKQGQQVLNLQVTEGLTVEITPNKDHDFTLPTKEVARGYGVTENVIRLHKSRHFDELLENKHYFMGVSKRHSVKDEHFKKMYWTKAGIIRLGFFIKSEQAKLFRNWAEKLILNTIEKPTANIELIKEAVAIAGSQNKLATRLGISSGELSLIINNDNRVSREAIERTERICNLIIQHGNDNSREAFELLMQIENRTTQKGLYKLMKKGGIL